MCVIFNIQFFPQRDNDVLSFDGKFQRILYKEIITIYFNIYMEGVNGKYTSSGSVVCNGRVDSWKGE